MMRALQCAAGAFFAIIVALSMTNLASAQKSEGKESKAKGAGQEKTQLELRISKDGRSIVDQDGKAVAHFVKGTRVQLGKGQAAQATASEVTTQLKGCMRCTRECLVYEGSRCVQWIRSCTWDFDC